ncbi:SpoIIE family protein phosphatase [Streptomyces sp. NPDC048641]|uniref:SpoIIE family protein phosphatase n=1 Tax=Streptomyces sp. NPDC048641 TaxID=3154825 RepID=UPI00343807C8
MPLPGKLLPGDLKRAVDRDLHGEKFGAALLAEVRGGGREVTFLNFGHPAPMLVRPDGSAHFPRPPQYALPLGLGVQGVEGPEPYTVGARRMVDQVGAQRLEGGFRVGVLEACATKSRPAPRHHWCPPPPGNSRHELPMIFGAGSRAQQNSAALFRLNPHKSGSVGWMPLRPLPGRGESVEPGMRTRSCGRIRPAKGRT